MESQFASHRRRPWTLLFGAAGAGILVVVVLLSLLGVYFGCRIEVPKAHLAILIKKTGNELANGQEIAPSEEYKGLQKELLSEGRYFKNPYHWDWDVVPQIEIPEGKLGVRIRLYGDNLPYGEILATKETQKGIIPGVLRPGRHAINAELQGANAFPRDKGTFLEQVELHEPVVIPAGFKGVVTNLSGPMPADPNSLLVDNGSRGVQQEILSAGTYYRNPYLKRINLVDCRSQRFNLSEGGEMGFPSKDGFWVTLDGVIEFRVKPEEAATVFVTYNDAKNDQAGNAAVDEEIISKVILPNARSFCRLRGSANSGKEFISGATRIKFQKAFQEELAATCDGQGIEIIQALITRINPPQQIADPVRKRQISLQEEEQYQKEILQQASEVELAKEKALILQKQALVKIQQEVVKVVTEAEQKQEVALIEAEQQLAVATLELEAAEDLAAATIARGKAKADVIQFDNEAEAAGWKKAVEAFNGDGAEFARWVLLKKLAPAFKQMMVNTADSPLMEIFQQYQDPPASPAAPAVPVGGAE